MYWLRTLFMVRLAVARCLMISANTTLMRARSQTQHAPPARNFRNAAKLCMLCLRGCNVSAMPLVVAKPENLLTGCVFLICAFCGRFIMFKCQSVGSCGAFATRARPASPFHRPRCVFLARRLHGNAYHEPNTSSRYNILTRRKLPH